MTQSELLKLAIEKAGSKQKLSELLGLKVQRIYEWEQGSEIRFNKMVDVLKIVGIGLKTYSLIEVVNVDFSEMNKPKRKLNVPTMRNPPPPPKRKIEKKIFFASKPFENAETIIKNNLAKKETPEKKFKCGCWINEKNTLVKPKGSKCSLYKSEHKF
jgi:hypothetical protein